MPKFHHKQDRELSTLFLLLLFFYTYLLNFPFFFSYSFLQICNVFGGKASKSLKNTEQIPADVYIEQLHEFLSKSSDVPLKSSPDKHTKRLTIQLPHAGDGNSQPTHLKYTCKRVVYRFMKGLFDERKLRKLRNVCQAEPIYFEVYIIVRIVSIQTGSFSCSLVRPLVNMHFFGIFRTGVESIGHQ